MKKLKITWVVTTVAFLFSCQQSELANKPVLNKIELSSILKANSEFDNLVSMNISYSNELSLNYSTLSKEKLNLIKRVVQKYDSPEDLLKRAYESERNLLMDSNPIITFGKEFNDLYNDLNSKYIFSKSDLIDLLTEPIKNRKSQNNTRTTACSSGMCEHIAMASYYQALYNGASEGGANTFMAGVYYGCMMVTCQL